MRRRIGGAPLGALGKVGGDGQRIGGHRLVAVVGAPCRPPAPRGTVLRALADMYEVAAGTIARAAIEAGLRAVTEQLRRAARSSARADGAREPPEADG